MLSLTNNNEAEDDNDNNDEWLCAHEIFAYTTAAASVSAFAASIQH